jgi:hypothetical protein
LAERASEVRIKSRTASGGRGAAALRAVLELTLTSEENASQAFDGEL